jgi:hypothetical protein
VIEALKAVNGKVGEVEWKELFSGVGTHGIRSAPAALSGRS